MPADDLSKLEKVIGVARAREQQWADRAAAWLEAGGSITGFAEEYGVSLTTARHYLAEAA